MRPTPTNAQGKTQRSRQGLRRGPQLRRPRGAEASGSRNLVAPPWLARAQPRAPCSAAAPHATARARTERGGSCFVRDATVVPHGAGLLFLRRARGWVRSGAGVGRCPGAETSSACAHTPRARPRERSSRARKADYGRSPRIRASEESAPSASSLCRVVAREPCPSRCMIQATRNGASATDRSRRARRAQRRSGGSLRWAC